MSYFLQRTSLTIMSSRLSQAQGSRMMMIMPRMPGMSGVVVRGIMTTTVNPSASTKNDGIPCWAKSLQQQLQELQQESKQLRQEYLALLQMAQRATNKGNKKSNELLEPVIRLEDGTVPSNFPETTTTLLICEDSSTIDSLLEFYGLPEVEEETMEDKMNRLFVFIGVNI